MRLIDANKLPYEDIECTDGKTYMVVNAYDVESAPTIKAITVPDNATNGDMIKVMFPNAEIKKQNEQMIVVDVEDNGIPHCFWKDWWDAPYKGV